MANQTCSPGHDRDKEPTVLNENSTEFTANGNNPSADIRKDIVPKTDPDPLGILRDEIDADKRSEQEEVVTVVKEQPTVEGTDDHTVFGWR